MPIIQTTKEMRARDPHDFYPTPVEVCDATLEQLLPNYKPWSVLDPGAGAGPWGKAARKRWPLAIITGVEARSVEQPHGMGYDYWEPRRSFIPLATPKYPAGPFKDDKDEQRKLAKYAVDLELSQLKVWEAPQQYDLVLGNPPYEHAEAFVRRSLAYTVSGGYVVFLLRLAFLEGQKRQDGLWRQLPPREVAVLGKRPSFTGNGKTDATAYAMFVWKKGYAGPTTLSWLNWDYAEMPDPAAEPVGEYFYDEQVA